MLNPSWILGYAKTSFTHHTTPITLPTKSGKKTSFEDLVKTSLPPCRLNPLLFNGHMQTMWTAMKDDGPPVHYKRHLFESTHSVYPGQFAVDFVVSKEESAKSKVDETLPERTTFYTKEEFEGIGSDDDKPMLVCLHGLSGGSYEVYLRQVVAPITEAGWESCVVNGRGCALSKITTSCLFNARVTWDLRQTIKYLRKTFPNRPLYGVGFSLGANILTNYVGEEGANCELKAVVGCSNPWNLDVCSTLLKKTWVGLEVYSRAMGMNMMKLYGKHKHMILQDDKIDEEKVKTCRHLFEFDRHVTAPTWGYPSEGAYHRDASSSDAVVAVKIPYLSINAEDDPISHKEGIPYEEFKQNPYTVLCTTNWGGHLSWFQFGGKRWFASAITAFLTKMHNEIDLSVPSEVMVEANGEVPTKKYPVFDPTHRRLIVPLE